MIFLLAQIPMGTSPDLEILGQTTWVIFNCHHFIWLHRLCCFLLSLTVMPSTLSSILRNSTGRTGSALANASPSSMCHHPACTQHLCLANSHLPGSRTAGTRASDHGEELLFTSHPLYTGFTCFPFFYSKKQVQVIFSSKSSKNKCHSQMVVFGNISPGYSNKQLPTISFTEKTLDCGKLFWFSVCLGLSASS